MADLRTYTVFIEQTGVGTWIFTWYVHMHSGSMTRRDETTDGGDNDIHTMEEFTAYIGVEVAASYEKRWDDLVRLVEVAYEIGEENIKVDDAMISRTHYDVGAAMHEVTRGLSQGTASKFINRYLFVLIAQVRRPALLDKYHLNNEESIMAQFTRINEMTTENESRRLADWLGRSLEAYYATKLPDKL